MRVLLDECVPARLKTILPGHSVRTVSEAGYRGFLDGGLLAAAQERFDVLLTVDRRIAAAHELEGLTIGVVLVRPRSNSFDAILPFAERIQLAVDAVKPGELITLS